MQELVKERSDDQENISTFSNMSYIEDSSDRGTVTEDEYQCIASFKETRFVESINDRDLNTKFGITNQFENVDLTKQISFGANPEYLASYEVTRSRGSTPKIDMVTPQKNITVAPVFEERKLSTPKEVVKHVAKKQKEAKPVPKNKNRTYIQLEKERCELPLVKLTKDDDNVFTDA